MVDSERLTLLVHASPWSWLAWLYGLQTVAALAFLDYFGLPFHQVAIPMGLLGFGTVYALLCRRLNRDFALSHKHYWVPVLVYALFIFAMSSRSYTMQTPLSFNTNLFHPLEYATLGILLCGAGSPLLLTIGPYPLVQRIVAGGFLYGISDEFHQAFVAGRTASGVDLMLDLVGLILGCGIFLAARWLQQRLNDRVQPGMVWHRP